MADLSRMSLVDLSTLLSAVSTELWDRGLPQIIRYPVRDAATELGLYVARHRRGSSPLSPMVPHANPPSVESA